MNSLRRAITLTCRPNLTHLLRANYSANTGTKEFIDGLVKDKKLVVFMKGTPDQPMCGFSKAVVQILDRHGVNTFETHDILEDEDLRQGIKEYSNWPTIPQVYMNGEFVGGCDIMLQMHQNGDLVEELEKIGIRSALLENEPSGKQG